MGLLARHRQTPLDHLLFHVWLILLITAIATWKATPIYRATIKLQIDPEQQSVLPFKEAPIDPGSTYAQSQEYLQTQFKVLESKSLAERVIKAMNLETNPALLGELDAEGTARHFSGSGKHSG